MLLLRIAATLGFLLTFKAKGFTKRVETTFFAGVCSAMIKRMDALRKGCKKCAKKLRVANNVQRELSQCKDTVQKKPTREREV